MPDGRMLFEARGSDPDHRGRESRVIVLTDAGGRPLTVVSAVPTGGCTQQIKVNGRLGAAGIPLCVEPILGVSVDGEVVVAMSWESLGDRSTTVRVVVHDVATGRAWQWQQKLPVYHPSKDLREAALAAAIASVPVPEVQAAFKRDLRVASNLPPFRAVMIGPDHSVWLAEAAQDLAMTWVRIQGEDEGGERVMLPIGFDLRAIVATNFIGVSTDADGLQSVVTVARSVAH